MATQSPFTFQEVIMRLERYWADQGCLIWQPYSEKLGAGTGNPATTLRVLGPEPWNVGYVEPSYRPDDGRFAENPNRMQMHTQYQVILKPDPGNPQELYLDSLRAIGVDLDAHDVRFVEDNWESPALGAWGLGWEVWLDGLEITQFTYFQQAGGLDLDPVAVELTYGMERIVMFLQGVQEVWDLQWDDRHTYGDVYKVPEVEHCEYAFNAADVERLQRLYDLYEAEFQAAIARGLVIPAYDYVLRCSHTFNLLDTRGAVGVTERANYFRRMRNMSRQVAEAYVAQRQRMEYPFLEEIRGSEGRRSEDQRSEVRGRRSEVGGAQVIVGEEADLLLEIGVEELPVADLQDAIVQLEEAVPATLAEARLDHGPVRVTGTPRRVVVYVERLAARQGAETLEFRGPPADRAFDADGLATQAAVGFARSKGLSVSDLVVQEEGGRRYVYAVQRVEGKPTATLLPELLRGWVASLRFAKSMRWNSSNVSFSRPLRWLVALYGDQVVPFEYGNVDSGNMSRGLRAQGAPQLALRRAQDYFAALAGAGIVVDRDERRRQIAQGIAQVAATVGGQVLRDDRLLDEVTGLVEQPLPLLGRFDPSFLHLPTPVLTTVMKKHQRYFPVVRGSEYQKSEYQRSEVRGSPDDQISDPPTSDPPTSDPLTPGPLLPYFITVANGADRDQELVTRGNEAVIRARYADAAYFVREDRKKPLEAFNDGLATLTFQEQLGSMLDKVRRLERLAPVVAQRLGLSPEETASATRAAVLSKADLATDMVVEMTSLQGVMGEIYALDSGEPPAVARAIREHYVVRPEDGPLSPAGLALNLSNRLDSLSGLFAVGLAPTSSADPFGLRRDALALVQNLRAAGRSFDVVAGLRAAGDLQPVPVSDDMIAETAAFVARRLHGVLRDESYAHDVVEAVLGQQGHDPARAARAVEALAQVVADPAWMDVLTAYARCKRIVRALDVRYPLAPQRYIEQATRDLHAAYKSVAPQVASSGQVGVLYEALQALVDPINRFFDDVLVMTEDPLLREARLALVQHIAALPDGIADLSLMQGF